MISLHGNEYLLLQGFYFYVLSKKSIRNSPYFKGRTAKVYTIIISTISQPNSEKNTYFLESIIKPTIELHSKHKFMYKIGIQCLCNLQKK